MTTDSVEGVSTNVISDQELARQVSDSKVSVSAELTDGSEDDKIRNETSRNNQTKFNSMITETLGDIAQRQSRSLERVMQLM